VLLTLLFIYRLEHCCWDHIDQTCFEHNHNHGYGHGHGHNYPSSQKQGCLNAQTVEVYKEAKGEEFDVDNDDVDEEAMNEIDDSLLNGHALTATALALQSAPSNIFEQINNLNSYLPPPPQVSNSDNPDNPPKCTRARAPVPDPDPATSTMAMRKPITWPSQTLTLASLRRLARTLNPTDAELAPVQAWFELVSLYGAGVATDKDVLAGLKRGLVKEVKCVTFGAAVQRDVFERALENVIGFVPRAPHQVQVQGQGRSQGVEGAGEMQGYGQGGCGGAEKTGQRDRDRDNMTGKEKPGFLRRFIHTAKGGNTGR